MSLDDVLHDLIERLSSGGEILGREQVRMWPEGALAVFEAAGWLKPAESALAVECPGCSDQCLMPVHVLVGQQSQVPCAFVACDQREEIGRVVIPLESLHQWQLAPAQVVRWVSVALGLNSKPEKVQTTGDYKLGTVRGEKRVCEIVWVSANPVSLKSGEHSLPLAEVVFFNDGALSLDRQAIQNLVDLPPAADSSKRYTPSTARREARKLETQAMHENWRKEFRRLKREKPGHTVVWYSKQIAKLPIAEGRDSETIRKDMVK